MSFNVQSVRRDLIANANANSEEFWNSVNVCGALIDAQLSKARSQGVLIAEKKPEKFAAAFMAAIDRKVPIILGNYQWGEREWAWFTENFSPAICFGLTEISRGNQSTFQATDQGSILIPTGGTSSNALRFVIHRWESLEAQSLMVQSFLGQERINSICCLPLFHVSGLMQLIRALVTQGQIVFCPLDELNKRLLKINAADFCLSLVPTQLNRLITQDVMCKAMAKLKVIFLGGAPADNFLLNQAKDCGLPIVLSYGMTETAGMICAQSKENFFAGKFSSGEPLSGVKIHLKAENNFDLIHIYANSLFYGYWGRQSLNRENGFCSKDYGHFLEGGQLVIEGRVDNWITSGGETINPVEIENSLIASGYIQSALVVGKASKDWGQAIVAILVNKSDLTQAQLLQALDEFLKQNLANHKRPKAYLFVEDLPTLANGKPDKSRISHLLESVNV